MYHTQDKPAFQERIGQGKFALRPAVKKCVCVHANGNVETVPLRESTVWKMAKGAQLKRYWAIKKARQEVRVAGAQAALDEATASGDARRIAHIQREFDMVSRARVLVDTAGWQRVKGTKQLGHLIPCAEHAHRGIRVVDMTEVPVGGGSVIGIVTDFEDPTVIAHRFVIKLGVEHTVEEALAL